MALWFLIAQSQKPAAFFGLFEELSLGCRTWQNRSSRSVEKSWSFDKWILLQENLTEAGFEWMMMWTWILKKLKKNSPSLMAASCGFHVKWKESPICSSHTLSPLPICWEREPQELRLESTDRRTRNSTVNTQSSTVGIHSNWSICSRGRLQVPSWVDHPETLSFSFHGTFHGWHGLSWSCSLAIGFNGF